jgi:ribosomal protein S12 methylthiotransferase accessory factor
LVHLSDSVTSAGDLLNLLQPLGSGLFTAAVTHEAGAGDAFLVTRVTSMGSLGVIWPEVAKRGNASSIHGTGTGLDEQDALIPALAEGLERYSTAAFRHEQFIWATAQELGREAIDLETIPRCSATELAHLKCPLVTPNKSKPIRWVRGFSLLDGRLVWLPVVMVYSHAGFASQSERFWLPISTGCAAHVSFERALIAAIYEVVERDAVSIAWRQQLPLPRIEVEAIPAPLVPFWERLIAASSNVEYLFFDATFDLGIPTVYGLQVARYNRRVTTTVHCATAASAAVALSKVIRDMAASKIGFRNPQPVPDDCDDFVEAHHGATYMARAENAVAFQFLTQSRGSKRLSEMRDRPRDGIEVLSDAIRIFQERQLPVYAADLSTDEAIRVGMRVVRVLIPGLQPLSLRPRAQFLAHARLYDAPARMGYPVRAEKDLNPWPQPFA